MVDKIITELIYSNIFSEYCWFPSYQKLSEHAKITAIQRMSSLVKKPRQPVRPCLGPPLPSQPWQPGVQQARLAERQGGELQDQHPGAARQASPVPQAPVLHRGHPAPPPVHPHQTPKIKRCNKYFINPMNQSYLSKGHRTRNGFRNLLCDILLLRNIIHHVVDLEMFKI